MKILKFNEHASYADCVCKCGCHSGNKVSHTAPCCYKCPKCGDERIKVSMKEAHEAFCSGEPIKESNDTLIKLDDYVHNVKAIMIDSMEMEEAEIEALIKKNMGNIIFDYDSGIEDSACAKTIMEENK